MDTLEEEQLDPRVQVELELLNNATDDINKLEAKLEEANSAFRTTLSESTERLKTLAKKLGGCIERARPYYEALDLARTSQLDCQRAAVQYQRANALHQAAKETIAKAEEMFVHHDGNRHFDSTWQDVLNRAIIKVMEAEAQKASSEREHLRRAATYQKAEREVQQLQRGLRSAINKSLTYFEEKSRVQAQLDTQKAHVQQLQQSVTAAKTAYAQSLRRLEQISEQIHEQRRCRLPREPGVGAELPPAATSDTVHYHHPSTTTTKSPLDITSQDQQYWESLREKLAKLEASSDEEPSEKSRERSITGSSTTEASQEASRNPTYSFTQNPNNNLVQDHVHNPTNTCTQNPINNNPQDQNLRPSNSFTHIPNNYLAQECNHNPTYPHNDLAHQQTGTHTLTWTRTSTHIPNSSPTLDSPHTLQPDPGRDNHNTTPPDKLEVSVGELLTPKSSFVTSRSSEVVGASNVRITIEKEECENIMIIHEEIGERQIEGESECSSVVKEDLLVRKSPLGGHGSIFTPQTSEEDIELIFEHNDTGNEKETHRILYDAGNEVTIKNCKIFPTGNESNAFGNDSTSTKEFRTAVDVGDSCKEDNDEVESEDDPKIANRDDDNDKVTGQASPPPARCQPSKSLCVIPEELEHCIVPE